MSRCHLDIRHLTFDFTPLASGHAVWGHGDRRQQCRPTADVLGQNLPHPPTLHLFTLSRLRKPQLSDVEQIRKHRGWTTPPSQGSNPRCTGFGLVFCTGTGLGFCTGCGPRFWTSSGLVIRFWTGSTVLDCFLTMVLLWVIRRETTACHKENIV